MEPKNVDQGRRTKIGQGGRIILAFARVARANSPPPHPLSDFPLLGILFQFFLFLSLGWPSLQGEGELPPPQLSQGNFPPSSMMWTVFVLIQELLTHVA